MSILENIHCHADLRKLDEQQRKTLCQQIRSFLVSQVSKTGGHLASNLGVVELTVALETVFDTTIDRLVFDVGHQSYVHKLLTGRQADFDTLRQFGGMAGFPKPSESDADAFVAGHSSSSVSIALGMARARTLTKQDYQVIALLGDGAATGGMVYEGLNDAAVSNEPMIVVLNDNAMSIDHNVGGMARHLSALRTKEKYLGMKKKYRSFWSGIPGGNAVLRFTSNVKGRIRRMLIPETFFESMGFTYLGPVDGHDTENLISLLKIARDMRRPVLLHVMTQKGRGYGPAEEHPKLFHGVGKFDPATGEVFAKSAPGFSDAFGEAMCALAAKDSRVCAITAAMPGGTGLLEFKNQHPDRMFDVGIAEEHAMSMAGGLAKQGMIPVVALYSTFLQRSYDMILQDICMLNLHTVLAVDRAGLVGEDGETHDGIFDVGFLRQAPGMQILCPASLAELQDMMGWAVLVNDGPVAVRYPRGGNRGYAESAWTGNGKNRVALHRTGDDVTIVTYGTLVENALDAAAELEKTGVAATVLRLLSISPLPVSEIYEKLSKNHRVFVMEETCTGSGICQELAWELQKLDKSCVTDGIDLGRNFVSHGKVDELYRQLGLDGISVSQRIQEALKNEN